MKHLEVKCKLKGKEHRKKKTRNSSNLKKEEKKGGDERSRMIGVS